MIKESLIAQQQSPQEVSKSIGLRLKENDLAILNQRFKIDGYENLSDLISMLSGNYLSNVEIAGSEVKPSLDPNSLDAITLGSLMLAIKIFLNY